MDLALHSDTDLTSGRREAMDLVSSVFCEAIAIFPLFWNFYFQQTRVKYSNLLTDLFLSI